MFSQGGAPQIILSLEDLERGIRTVHFYLGQVQDALKLLEAEDHAPVEVSERTKLLASTLERLRSHLDSGRLAICFIQEEYNKIAPQTQAIGSAKAMGALLRTAGMNTTPGKHDANGRRAVYCLEWNQKTENFIKRCLEHLQRLQTQEWQGFKDADIENPMSASSSSSTDPDESAQTLKTPENPGLHPETYTSSGPTDNADIADMMEVEI
jgi:hypothetical protein